MMLVDTSGILSMTDRREPDHARAVSEFLGVPRFVTHNYVLAEWVPLANTRRLSRPDALRAMADLVADARGQVIFVDRDTHDEAVELLAARLDKTYPLCDAVSFVLMDRLGLTNALTTDKHFEQAGFARLLG